MNSDFIKSIAGLAFKYNSYSKLVEELYLKAIVDSFQRLQIIPNISSMIENQIRNRLAYDIENSNQLLRPFIQAKILKFTKENTILLSQTESKRTDIEFFISFAGDFVVECKRLESADQRYVNEGLSRFTQEYYSKSNTEASMIGFVVGGDISKISDGLKSRVEQHNPTANCQQFLKQLCIKYQYSFHSEHNRKTQQPILLHHLFVKL